MESTMKHIKVHCGHIIVYSHRATEAETIDLQYAVIRNQFGEQPCRP